MSETQVQVAKHLPFVAVICTFERQKYLKINQ